MKEINIAEVLKNKPRGIKLYSPIFGECTFSFIQGVTDAICVITNDNREFFDYKGLYSPTGEFLLFPSKYMHDWSKFTWKKGDVLISNDGKKEVFFNGFTDDTYALFKAKHGFEVLSDGNTMYFADEDDIATSDYTLENKNDAQTYINTIEERLGGKLNRKTLEIEKAQPEFKDGDIVFAESHMLGINTSSMIAIFRKEKEIDKYKFSPALCESNEHDTYLREGPVVLSPSDIKIFRHATDSEKQQLFDALAKENKNWDSEHKMIVDLKPKVELKPFDKVLVRDFNKETWEISFFGFKEENDYVCINGKPWYQCLLYEGNEHLLGTTKDPK